jgi:hypothetical protein
MDADNIALAVFDPLSDQAIREHFVGKWDIYVDKVFPRGSGAPFTLCHVTTYDYFFDLPLLKGYFDIAVAVQPYWNVTLLEGGLVEIRNYSHTYGSTGSECTAVLPPQNARMGSWSVNNGVIRTDVNAQALISELKEAYVDYEFNPPDRFPSTKRLIRNEP